jgi:hypothetical protein
MIVSMDKAYKTKCGYDVKIYAIYENQTRSSRSLRHPDSGAIADAKYQLYCSFDLPEDADHCEDYWPIEENEE